MKADVKQAPIGYSGVVTLTTLDKRGMEVDRRIIKNNGVNNLFLLLCNFLIGNLTSGLDDEATVSNIRNLLPKYLAIGSPTTTADTKISMQSLQDVTEMGLTERFPLITNSSVVVDTNGLAFVQWSCNIPHTSVGTASIKELGLYPSAQAGTSDMLARITTTRGLNPGIVIGDGQSLLVNWRIYFTNKVVIRDKEEAEE